MIIMYINKDYVAHLYNLLDNLLEKENEIFSYLSSGAKHAQRSALHGVRYEYFPMDLYCILKNIVAY